jgi:hypothetical protein
MLLPLIPHCDLDPECCGCLMMEVMGEDGIFFRCNESGAVLTKEQVAPLILAMESCEVTCPLCGPDQRVFGSLSFRVPVLRGRVAV